VSVFFKYATLYELQRAKHLDAAESADLGSQGRSDLGNPVQR
jgi:hypothetical protein